MSSRRQRDRTEQLRIMNEFEKPFERKLGILLRNKGKSLAKAYPDVEQAIHSQNEQIGIIATKYVMASLLRFYKRLQDQVGAKKEDVVEMFMLAYARNRAGALIRGITGYDRNLLNRIIQRSIEENLTEQETSKLIRDTLVGVSRSRAKRISRTEIHRSANIGALSAAQVSGIEMNKIWTAKLDDRTRDCHRMADGQTVPLNSTFTVCGEQIQAPGQGSASNSINCRCTTIYQPV